MKVEGFPMLQRIQVIDSHTGGEPTRTIISGGPDLGHGSMADRRAIFRARFDGIRSAVINEPRGSDVLVGALLCEPVDSANVAGVIFFNNAGMLNMCGHGTIGVAVTRAGSPGPHLGWIVSTGNTRRRRRLRLPHGDYRVTIENVPSYRLARHVSVTVDEYGNVTGDVAWGGNWFFLVGGHGQELELANVESADRLRLGSSARHAESQRHHRQGRCGDRSHRTVPARPRDSRNQSRNFVLCPEEAATTVLPAAPVQAPKLACLVADGVFRPPGRFGGKESIIGSVF